MPQYDKFLGLGIAGNFALHLDQAGEAEDFKDIITADEAAPKGIFPFFLPSYMSLKEKTTRTPKEILTRYPLSHDTLKLPNTNLNIQAEPEVGLLCQFSYKDGKIDSIVPTHFGAYNDSSIRVSGAQKISDKKNWGAASKGIASTLFPIDKFSDGGIMDSFSICSFLKRDGLFTAYGENVELCGYSYFYSKLTEWIKNQINTQENFGPLEPLLEYIKACNYPSNVLISIGATRYTEYGEKTFLQAHDTLYVVVYNHNIYTLETVKESLKNTDNTLKEMSVLTQVVV